MNQNKPKNAKNVQIPYKNGIILIDNFLILFNLIILKLSLHIVIVFYHLNLILLDIVIIFSFYVLFKKVIYLYLNEFTGGKSIFSQSWEYEGWE